MMWGIVRRAAVTAAVLAGASVIACAQDNSTTGVSGDQIEAGPGRPSAASGPTAGNPPDRGAPGPGDRTGSLPSCATGPPFVSLPCRPATR
jgi:hypothetical protein